MQKTRTIKLLQILLPLCCKAYSPLLLVRTILKTVEIMEIKNSEVPNIKRKLVTRHQFKKLKHGA